MKFKDLIVESSYLEDKELFDEFIDLVTDYIDFSDKSVIDDIYKLTKGTNLITKAKKVYRVMAIEKGSDIKLSDRKMISTSTSQVKGKALKDIIDDNVERSKRYKGIKEPEVVTVEIDNVSGININDITKQALKKDSELNNYLDDETKDMFKRLKGEKEFLVINDNLKFKKLQK